MIITAALNRTPFIAFEYAPKIKSVLESLSLEKYSMQWPIADEKELYNRIDFIINNRNSIIEEINDKLYSKHQGLINLYKKMDYFFMNWLILYYINCFSKLYKS